MPEVASRADGLLTCSRRVQAYQSQSPWIEGVTSLVGAARRPPFAADEKGWAWMVLRGSIPLVKPDPDVCVGSSVVRVCPHRSHW